MIETRELLQESQLGLCRVINRNASLSREQTRERVYVAALGLRHNGPRPRSRPLVIESAQLAEHSKAIFIAQLPRAVTQLSEPFGAYILDGIDHPGPAGEQVAASGEIRFVGEQRRGRAEGDFSPLPIDERVRFVILDLAGDLLRAG